MTFEQHYMTTKCNLHTVIECNSQLYSNRLKLICEKRAIYSREMKNTYPDDVIVGLGLFMSPFHWNERTFICHRCGFCDGVVAFIRPIWRLHMQRSAIVNFIGERSRIKGARIARIAIVSMRWLTWTWPIQGYNEKKNNAILFHFQNLIENSRHRRRFIRLCLTAKVGLCSYSVHNNRYRRGVATPSLHAISAVATATMFGQMI